MQADYEATEARFEQARLEQRKKRLKAHRVAGRPPALVLKGLTVRQERLLRLRQEAADRVLSGFRNLYSNSTSTEGLSAAS